MVVVVDGGGVASLGLIGAAISHIFECDIAIIAVTIE
jgi:hypothetical protein